MVSPFLKDNRTAMAKGHVLTLARCSHRHSQSISTLPGPPPGPHVMIYDRLAEAVKQKLRRLENSEDRFLKYNNPRPKDMTPPLLSFPLTRVTTLPNGLRVATESTPDSPETATVGIWIDGGSRYEPHNTHGTASFLDRIIFMGTKRRTKRQLEQEIEDIGGELFAETLREKTAYYATVMANHVPLAVDILSDILQNPRFSAKRIHRVRNEILEEFMDDNHKVLAQTEELIFDQLHATAFQHSPLGRTIPGPAKNVSLITKEDLQNYISTHYTAPRMVIVASGAVKHEEIVEQVKSKFIKLSEGLTTTSKLAAEEPAIFTGSEVRIIDDSVPLAQFAVAFKGASWTDPDSTALMVMQTIWGSYNKRSVSSGGGKHQGSMLVQRIAINDIAECMTAFNYNYKDTGLFGVHAVAKPDCLDDLAYAIMYEVTQLCYRASEDDVVRARNQLKFSLLTEGTISVAQDIGHQLLAYGRRIPYAELFARIDAVDSSTIKRVACRFIKDKDIAIAAVGPVQGLPDYNYFARRTYWNRY